MKSIYNWFQRWYLRRYPESHCYLCGGIWFHERKCPNRMVKR